MFTQCVLCLDTARPLTEEHIFPEAAGGKIVKRLLCKPCNDKLGRWVDSAYVAQKHIQLARITYKITGKTGKIPQPFSDTYSIDNQDSALKIKLDQNFAPRVVPQAPKIWVTTEGTIGLNLSIDITYKSEIPKIITTALTRFFKSDEGARLGWSNEQKTNAIKRSIDSAINVEPQSQQIHSVLSGKWTIDLKTLFTEHVKVIYEISCLEFGTIFINSQHGERLRNFLHAQCKNEPENWDLSNIATHLNVAPDTPPQLNELIKHLANNDLHTNHIAIATSSGVICSMLGMGATFQTKNLELPTTTPKIYLSSITGGKSGVFTLAELLSAQGSKGEVAGCG